MKNDARPALTLHPLSECQSGQSMVELLVILPVMLLLIFGAIQVGLIYHAKITLNYAAYEAVRAGTLNCDKKYSAYSSACTSDVGQFGAVKEGFARGLAPLYSYFESNKERRSTLKHPAHNEVEAFQQARERIFAEFDNPKDLIRIERLNPTDQTFNDFAKDPVIPNDNLMNRSTTPDGQGSSIQDANLLHLRITYWYPLYVPLINNLVFNIFICCKDQDVSTSCRWASDPVCRGSEPRIPLTATAAMRMQVPVENSPEYY